MNLSGCELQQFLEAKVFDASDLDGRYCIETLTVTDFGDRQIIKIFQTEENCQVPNRF